MGIRDDWLWESRWERMVRGMRNDVGMKHGF